MDKHIFPSTYKFGLNLVLPSDVQNFPSGGTNGYISGYLNLKKNGAYAYGVPSWPVITI